MPLILPLLLRKKRMLKIGVVGAGHFGRFHIQSILQIPGYSLAGFFDINPDRSKEISEEFGIRSYASYAELLDDVEVVDIVVPTVSHFDCAQQALKQQKHVFLEKPLTASVQEAEVLLKLSQEAQVKAQAGHIERFNPAYLAARAHISNPMFIEIHRLAEFTPRSTDVSVIYNLMIHDIDIVLSVVKANLKRVHASGVKVVTESTDIASARLEFDNGCVANITASRISTSNMRRMRFFQKEMYINADCLNKKAEILRMKNGGGFEFTGLLNDSLPYTNPDDFISEPLDINNYNAIKAELEHFHDAIKNNTDVAVSFDDGYQALKVAGIISEKIESAL